MKLYIKRGKKIINLLQKADLNVKSRKLKIKEIIKNFESIYKNGQKIHKFRQHQSWKQKFEQNKTLFW